MRRTYAVTVLVDVTGDTERDFDAACLRLRQDPPFLDVTSAGADGSFFSLRTRLRGVSVRRARKP